MHSQAHGSDADSVVPLYRLSTHWQLGEPVVLAKLYSGQDTHASFLYPSLNVPAGHSVRRENKTHTSKESIIKLYLLVKVSISYYTAARM